MFNLKNLSLMLVMLCATGVWAEPLQQNKGLSIKAQETVEEVKLQEAAIDINNADAKQLSKLANVGLKKAQRIVEYRIAHGRFTSIDDLQNVKGIGKATVEKNRMRMIAASK
ncbi:MAG: helix-hairpin-helix domain-containing protein [Bermanella sp.]